MDADRRYWFRRRSWSIGYEPDAPGGWIVLFAYVVAFVGGIAALLAQGPHCLPGATPTWLAVLWGAACTGALVVVAITHCDPNS